MFFQTSIVTLGLLQASHAISTVTVRINTGECPASTSSASPQPTGLSRAPCPAAFGSDYITSRGVDYNLYCNTEIVGNDLPAVNANSLADCLDQCDAYVSPDNGNGCVAVSYAAASIPGNCELKYDVTSIVTGSTTPLLKLRVRDVLFANTSVDSGILASFELSPALSSSLALSTATSTGSSSGSISATATDSSSSASTTGTGSSGSVSATATDSSASSSATGTDSSTSSSATGTDSSSSSSATATDSSASSSATGTDSSSSSSATGTDSSSSSSATATDSSTSSSATDSASVTSSATATDSSTTGTGSSTTGTGSSTTGTATATPVPEVCGCPSSNGTTIFDSENFDWVVLCDQTFETLQPDGAINAATFDDCMVACDDNEGGCYSATYRPNDPSEDGFNCFLTFDDNSATVDAPGTCLVVIPPQDSSPADKKRAQ